MAQNDAATKTLDEFAAQDEDSDAVTDPAATPPAVVKRTRIKHPTTNRTLGFIVWDRARGWNSYLTSRTVEDNLFHKYNSFPISTSVLGKIQTYDVERVLIPVRDDETYGGGTVYEIPVEQYLPKNSPTYEWDREGFVDEQVCPDKDEDALYIWPELSGGVWDKNR